MCQRNRIVTFSMTWTYRSDLREYEKWGCLDERAPWRGATDVHPRSWCECGHRHPGGRGQIAGCVGRAPSARRTPPGTTPHVARLPPLEKAVVEVSSFVTANRKPPMRGNVPEFVPRGPSTAAHTPPAANYPGHRHPPPMATVRWPIEALAVLHQRRPAVPASQPLAR
jgi:hypothetical protein